MNIRKFILRETGLLALGELICIGAMIGLYAILGYLDYRVFLGAAVGLILAVGNFFFMALTSNAAADRAADQDVKQGKAMVKGSYIGRLLVIGVLLLLLGKSGHCNVIAMVCPLFFVFPVLTVVEFFRKAGVNKS